MLHFFKNLNTYRAGRIKRITTKQYPVKIVVNMLIKSLDNKITL